jgi:ribosomal protein S18 acetylase RimI-like enzyme
VPTYRAFRNDDPPSIRDLWNLAAEENSRVAVVRSCDMLENYLFSKPYFEPDSLSIAEEDNQIVGFSLAGFGYDPGVDRLDHTQGSICLLFVHPNFRKRGIGTELIRRAETYLRRGGAAAVFAGSYSPCDAYGLGLYGGARTPGVLDADDAAVKLISKLGYTPKKTAEIFRLRLDADFDRSSDPRLPLLRRTVKIYSESFPAMEDWWAANTIGLAFCYRFDLEDGEEPANAVGTALVWEMEGFAREPDGRAFGIYDLFIDPSFRRKGYAKLFMLSILRHLRDNRINYVEVQIDETNSAARGLLTQFGFEQVAAGRMFQAGA